MSITNIKKLTVAVVFAALAVIAPLIVSNTEATFPGPDTPPVNGKIVYSTANGKTIRAANADGSEGINLFTDQAATLLGDPMWSADKSKVVFSMLKNDQQHIYTVNGNEADQTATQLTSGAGQAGAVDPAWSPEGDKIVFARGVNGVSNIFVMDADGTNQEQLTNNTNSSMQAYDPHWSPVPGSKQIVYTVGTLPLSPPWMADIWTGTINGGYDGFSSNSALSGASVSGSTNEDNRGEYDARFTPNGERVIFVRRTLNGSYNISSVRANNTGDRQSHVELGVSGGPVYDPVMSPDGVYIAYIKTPNLLTPGPLNIRNINNNAEFTMVSQATEPDWTWFGEGDTAPEDLEDVNIECTTQVGQTCVVENIPQFCTSALEVEPLRGISSISGTTLTYAPTQVSNEEENYVHVRTNANQTAKCNVKIKFTGSTTPGGGGTGGGTIAGVPKTGLAGGIVGAALAGALAGGAIYYNEQKGKKTKKLKSEK
jgi:hypothetical protein